VYQHALYQHYMDKHGLRTGRAAQPSSGTQRSSGGGRGGAAGGRGGAAGDLGGGGK